MNILDWFLLGIAAFSVLRGLMRGAVSQIFSLAGILTGFYLASHYYAQMGIEFNRNFPSLSPSTTGIISFIVLFMLTWFCIAGAGHWIARIMRGVGLGFLDRLWGGIFGFFKALILAIALVSVLTLFAAPSGPLLTQSKLVPYVHEASTFLFSLAPNGVKDEFLKKKRELERFWLEKKPSLPDPASHTPLEKEASGKIRKQSM